MIIENPTKEQLYELKGIIYLFINIINNKCYVGQSTLSFYERYRSVSVPKYNNSHISSIYLSRSIKKYGRENFSIVILEYGIIDINKLNELEDFYAIKYNCYYPNGYNLTKCGNNKKHSEQTKLKLSKSKRKTYEYLDAKDNYVFVDNLKQFCLDNDLSYKCMVKVNNIKNCCHKGYTTLNADRNIAKQMMINKKYKVYRLKNIITGEIVEFYNLSHFVKENKLNFGKIIDLIKSRIILYLNWCLPETNDEDIKIQIKIRDKFTKKH